MKILVTGATGFIGGHLIEELVNRNHQIRVIIRDKKKSELYYGKSIETCIADVTDPSSLNSLMEGVEIVFHLASIINSKIESYDVYFKTNSLGTLNLLKAVKLSSAKIKRFVFSSSVGVFGPLQSIPANEETKCNPLNYYEKSKYEAEEIVRDTGKRLNVPVSIIRPSWVYGPSDTRTFKLFRSINNRRFFIIGDGKTLIHPVYVKDVVQGLIRCAFEKNATNKTYIIAGNKAIMLQSLVEIIAKHLNRKIPRIRFPSWAAKKIAIGFEKIYGPFQKIPPISQRRLAFFSKNQAFDISKAKSEIGYQPEVDLDDGIMQTVKWYRGNNWL
jgi:nucleoside-diphosphate-sugar epimerase